MSEWQKGRPPNEQIVEVEWEDAIVRVEAFYGRDGYRPHWRSVDGGVVWEPSAFKRWRVVERSEHS